MVATREQGRGGPRRWKALLLALAVLLSSVLPTAARQVHGGSAHDIPHAMLAGGEDCHPDAIPADAGKGEAPAAPHDHGPPGLACCVAIHCSMLPVALPLGGAWPMPAVRDVAHGDALGPWPPGLAARPDLPPPRG